MNRISFYLILLFCIHAVLLFATNDSSHIWIHFIHGSKNKKGCEYMQKRVGGLWGGHVEIQVDSLVYGFEFKDRKNIHLFAQQKPQYYNATFTRINYKDWLIKNKDEKCTSIQIPVNSDQKDSILQFYRESMTKSPYDYAFFGKRCTSSALQVLHDVGVLEKKKSRRKINWKYFYPRRARNKLTRWSKNRAYLIMTKPGIECKKWD